MTTIDRCRDFYIALVAPMIHERFPEYENRIAAGLAGEGSECWGYDDEYSRDHDFAISICLWLTDDDFDAIGSEVDAAYKEVVAEQINGTRLEHRRGVQRISDFYRKILGFDPIVNAGSLTEEQWFYTDDWKFSTAVNGEVFRDDLGHFSRIRESIIGYYPERIYRMKLVNALHGYSAAVQANYPRCMAREDYVTAHTCISKGIEEAIRTAFMLKKRYMPYYKWAYHGLKELAYVSYDDIELQKLTGIIKTLAETDMQSEAWKGYRYSPASINYNDDVVRLSEEIAGMLAQMLYDNGLTNSRETFLEAQCNIIARGITA